MKTRFTFFSTAILFCCCFFFSTQELNAQNIIEIRGEILDKETGKPIPYAHVGIPKYGIGTVTSDRGVFVFKYPKNYSEENFVVSYLGYESFEKRIATISSPVVVRLKSNAIDLAEVVVMDESKVEGIIRKATSLIPKNYPTIPTKVQGFYRQSRTDKDQNYLYLAEGVLEVYKSSYKKRKEGQTRLIQGRYIDLTEPDSTRRGEFASGHWSAHRFDFVKNKIAFIDEKYFPAYKYFIKGITNYNDRPVYIIGFDQEGNNKDGQMKGEMYIDTLSYAFLRAEFEFLPKALKKWNNYPLYMGNWKSNRYVVDYRQVDGKWYLSDALREGVYSDGSTYLNEIAITEIKTKRARPIPYGQRMDRDNKFIQVTGEYDEDFWKSYNTTELNDRLAESVRQVKNQEKAEEVFDSTYIAKLELKRDSLMVERQIELPSPINENRKKRERFTRFRTRIGVGVHHLNTAPATIGVTYLKGEPRQPVISVNNTIKRREYEFPINIDSDIAFHRHFFFRAGFSLEFLQNIYQSNSVGVGAQVTLFKKYRPVFVRVIAQHSRLDYATKIGQANNEFGEFEAGNDQFSSDKINMYYGTKVRGLKLTLELALELNRKREFFISGSYFLPYAEQRHIYLWERDRLYMFRRKERIELNDDVRVTRDGEPFRGRLTDYQSFQITLGIVLR